MPALRSSSRVVVWQGAFHSFSETDNLRSSVSFARPCLALPRLHFPQHRRHPSREGTPVPEDRIVHFQNSFIWNSRIPATTCISTSRSAASPRTRRSPSSHPGASNSPRSTACGGSRSSRSSSARAEKAGSRR